MDVVSCYKRSINLFNSESLKDFNRSFYVLSKSKYLLSLSIVLTAKTYFLAELFNSCRNIGKNISQRTKDPQLEFFFWQTFPLSLFRIVLKFLTRLLRPGPGKPEPKSLGMHRQSGLLRIDKRMSWIRRYWILDLQVDPFALLSSFYKLF